MAQAISVYDTEWGKFLKLTLCQNTLTVKITNNLDCILLFLLESEPSPLYSSSFDSNYGACTTAESKAITIQLEPQFDLNSISIPYQIPIILAKADITRIFTLYDIKFTEKSLMDNFHGRKFHLSIIIKNHGQARLLQIEDIELLENCDTSVDSFCVKDLNVYKLLERALVILKSRYEYMKNEGASDTVIEPYAQKVLKFKVSLDYWKYLTYDDRIAAVNEFLDFLKFSTFCPVCFGNGNKRESVFCGQCGAYIGCCQEHAKQFSALHFSECDDFRAVSVLRFLEKNEIELAITQDTTSNYQKLSEDPKSHDPAHYRDPSRDKWIQQASDHIRQTEDYLNEICDFAVGYGQQNKESDPELIQNLIEESREDKVEEVDVQQSVDEMMKVFQNMERERKRFEEYLQDKYGLREGESTPRVMELENVSEFGAQSTVSSGDGKGEIKLSDDVSRILNSFDYTNGNGFYASALERIESIYQEAAIGLENNIEAYKFHRQTYFAEAEELLQDFESNFERVIGTIKTDHDDISQLSEVSSAIKENEELSLVYENLKELNDLPNAKQVSDIQDRIVTQLANLETLTYEAQKAAEYIEKQAVVETKVLSEEQKRRGEGQYMLDVCSYFSEEAEDALNFIEACIYDEETYERMKNCNAINLDHLKKCPVELIDNASDAPIQGDAEQTTKIEPMPQYKVSEETSQSMTAISINLKEKRVGIHQIEPLERFSGILTECAKEFNEIKNYNEESFFKLFAVSQRAYSVVFVNMERALQRRLTEFDIALDLSFGDIRHLRRQMSGVTDPPQLLRYIRQWLSIIEEYELLQEQIERHVYYCMAYTPSVLDKYPRGELPVPEINFGRITEYEAALLMDGVEDL